MSKVLITGSADGLGREAARQLVRGGHEVVLHARDEARAQQALAGVPGAAAALPGDLSSITSTRALADVINAAGVFDAIIHNAGIGYREPTRRETEDGLEHVFETNVVAPYLLTALVNRPARLIYLSSGLHRAEIQTSRTCSGSTGAGTATRRTPTPSCSTRCLPPRSLAAGRTSSAAPWTPAGCERRWGDQERPARSDPEPRRRSGSRPVTTHSPGKAAATSTTEDCAKRTQPSPTPSSKTAYSPPALS